jgi:hypothetical protein
MKAVDVKNLLSKSISTERMRIFVISPIAHAPHYSSSSVAFNLLERWTFANHWKRRPVGSTLHRESAKEIVEQPLAPRCPPSKPQTSHMTRCPSKNRRNMTVWLVQRSKLTRVVRHSRRQFSSSTNHDGSAALPYQWTQDLNSATVTVNLPSGTRARDLLVTIKKKSLKVR